MGNPSTVKRATFGPSSGQANGAATVMLQDSAGATVKMSVAKGTLTNRAFKLRASGVFTAVAGNQTVLIKAVQNSTGTAPGTGDTTIATSGALAAANPGSFLIEFESFGNPNSDNLRGIVTGQVGDVAITYAVGLVATFDPDLDWVFGVALTSATSATVILKNLELDLL